jgi:hypothetical protein
VSVVVLSFFYLLKSFSIFFLSTQQIIICSCVVEFIVLQTGSCVGLREATISLDFTKHVLVNDHIQVLLLLLALLILLGNELIDTAFGLMFIFNSLFVYHHSFNFLPFRLIFKFLTCLNLALQCVIILAHFSNIR